LCIARGNGSHLFIPCSEKKILENIHNPKKRISETTRAPLPPW
jgi:hypothetical protein